jgi:hypothetical protein
VTKTLLYTALLIFFFTSCKKETGVAGPAGPSGNNGLNGNLLDTGTLNGKLSVYDEYSWPLPDLSGVKVSLTVNNTAQSVLSDKSGNYQFNGLPAGTYNLSFEKNGYGTMKMFGVSHFAPSILPTVVPEVFILQKPIKTAVDSISLIDGGSYIVITIYLDTSAVDYNQYQGNFLVFIGKDSILNASNALYSPYSQFISGRPQGYYQTSGYKTDFAGNNNISPPYYITVGTFNRFVHRSLTGLNLFDTHDYSYYINPDDGKYVYPNLSLSPNSVLLQ